MCGSVFSLRTVLLRQIYLLLLANEYCPFCDCVFVRCLLYKLGSSCGALSYLRYVLSFPFFPFFLFEFNQFKFGVPIVKYPFFSALQVLLGGKTRLTTNSAGLQFPFFCLDTFPLRFLFVLFGTVRQFTLLIRFCFSGSVGWAVVQ